MQCASKTQSVLCLTCDNNPKVRIARFFPNFHPYVDFAAKAQVANQAGH